MRIVTEFPRPVREIENLWLPLADGIRLAARAWLPRDVERDPVPAILECIPYRKRDGTVWRDEQMHPYVAGHGYAVLRVDLRGTGDSDGLIEDEYTAQEQRDCVEAIAWAAAQPWCTGAVGMMGISWGGFNALQVAAHRPPALKAIITMDSTDDRYADDVHYMGGAMLHDNFAWASAMYAYLSLPPDPAIVGEGWREAWLGRLDHAGFWLRQWLQHQRRDEYWKQGSVREDYDRIECAVLAVGGWEDGYTNAVPRLLAGLKAPAMGLVGPWGHAFPHSAHPGPSIGFLQETIRWWDHWLKGAANGLTDEPRYRIWINDSFRPAVFSEARAGRWVAETGWPSPRIKARKMFLDAERRLSEKPGRAAALQICSPLDTGLGSLEWCSYGDAYGDLPGDQRGDDGRSLCFDTEPLAEPLELLGAPVLTLAFSVDKPVAAICVRLCDVWPDGASSRATYTLFNLTHYESHESPECLEPGKRYVATIALNHAGHRFAAGQRIRLAISTCYWPMMWPSSEPATLAVHAGECRLELPERPPRAEDAALRPFAAPEHASGPREHWSRPGIHRRSVTQDPVTGETTVVMEKDGGATHLFAIDLESDMHTLETYRVKLGDPLSATGETSYRSHLRRGDWSITTLTRTWLRLDATHFHATAELEAFDGAYCVFEKREAFSVPRDCL
jgi:uncharacterized protein